MIQPLRGHLASLETFWSPRWQVLLASSGSRPEVRPNTQQCTGQPPTTKNYPAQKNVRSAEAEKAWTTIVTALSGLVREGSGRTVWRRFFLKGLGALTVNHPGVRKRNRGGETGKRKRGQKNSRPGERDWCPRDGGGPTGNG